jgi:hypothetical protein
MGAVYVLIDPPAARIQIDKAGVQHRHALADELADAPLADVETARQFGLGDFHRDPPV